MSLEIVFSVFAIFISVLSLIYTIWSARRQEYLNSLANNLSHMSEIERMIADNPNILKLHGIDPNELKRIGISGDEFAYLLSNFTAGGLYYRSVGIKTRKPFKPNTYRYNMLKSSHTRKAWPLLRTLIEPSLYRDRIEATITWLDNEEKQAKH